MCTPVSIEPASSFQSVSGEKHIRVELQWGDESAGRQRELFNIWRPVDHTFISNVVMAQSWLYLVWVYGKVAELCIFISSCAHSVYAVS